MVSNVSRASTQDCDIMVSVVCVNEENNSGERIIQLLCFLFQLWNELCEMISKNPDKVTSLKVYAIIQQGIKRYTDQVGQLWKSLADYYVRSGHFEKVRIIVGFFTRGQFWPSGIVVACVCLSVCPSVCPSFRLCVR